MTKTKYSLNEKVKLKMSAEHGEVIGVCIYAEDAPRYLIRYMAGDGRQTESFWVESAIEPNLALAA